MGAFQPRASLLGVDRRPPARVVVDDVVVGADGDGDRQGEKIAQVGGEMAREGALLRRRAETVRKGRGVGKVYQPAAATVSRSTRCG
jgi:hypothetical protein